MGIDASIGGGKLNVAHHSQYLHQGTYSMNTPPLMLNNTMSRNKDLFRPLQPPHVKLFTCGPSVYRHPHLGNYRTFFYEDILHRYLSHLGFEVERVVNFTDIEDKSISEARRKQISVDDLTRPVEERFFEDCRFLSIDLPPFIPRSSTSVHTAAEIIEGLLEKKHAYSYGPDIYFDPLTFQGFGRLYRLDMSKWPSRKKRFSKDTYPGQRWNLGDFILWHGARDNEPAQWETVLGKGRPAWNVQDPAMIVKHLGTQIDISCGGIDNLYRHHDYTIAVTEAYSGKELAPYWLHGEHLLVDGHKMSKNKGNIIHVGDLASKGYDGAVIRFFFATQHYRKKLNFTYAALDAAAKRHARLIEYARVFTTDVQPDKEAAESSHSAGELLVQFENALSDDLHTERALDDLEHMLMPLSEARKEGTLNQSDTAGICHVLQKIDMVLKTGINHS
ncbi:MAG: class I tRNA ligase family protein [Chitinivibrionales bacterium]|nr:class I tRNA ligase family protein [Chitinivibrionales bacterium]